MIDLSIVIPSRNEEWLPETIQDILSNLEGNTEIIAVLDGETHPKPLPEHPRVTYIRHYKSRGQRASTNDGARVARGRYLMKTDGHTAWDKGFDVKLLKGFTDNGDNIVQVPVMRNLHVFDWVCEDGHRRYQGPSGPCASCGKPTEKEVIWNPKNNPQSTTYRFDHTLHFQYFNEWKRSKRYQKEKKTGYTETMSLQGSCFVVSAEKYWELELSEEAFGSWGQQGTEVACKMWLSGGRCIVNHSTWYGHLFRTSGGDFGFPYKQQNSQVEAARAYSRKLFLDNTWNKQIYPLSWLIDRFDPVPNWHDGKDEGMLQKVRDWGANFKV